MAAIRMLDGFEMRPTDHVQIIHRSLVALGFATMCALSSGCAAAAGSGLSGAIVICDVFGNTSCAVGAAERLLNLTDADFSDDRHTQLAVLTFLGQEYREQKAYGKEELVRQRELRLWFSLRAPAPAADRSTAAEADQDLEEVRAHYSGSGMSLSHPTALQLLNNYADRHSVSGRYVRAESLLSKVLALQQAAAISDGAVASESHRLGELYLLVGKPADAERQFRRAVELRRKVYGADHFFVASSLLGLADAALAIGLTDSAIDSVRDALKIEQATYGTDHPQIAYCLDRLATMLNAGGRQTEAENARAAAAAMRKRFGTT
jgi:tetratricopeptide (TPR) repeat protein